MQRIPSAISIGTRLVILALLGCSLSFFTATANEAVHDACQSSGSCGASPMSEILTLIELLRAHPDLIRMQHVLIHANTQPMCVIFIENAEALAQTSEVQPIDDFSSFKRNLLAIGFTVYEFLDRSWNLKQTRPVMLTHEAFRDEAQCTNAVVSQVPSNYFLGSTEFINRNAVVFLNQQGIRVSRPAVLKTSSISTSEAASGCPQASWVEQANLALQQPIHQAKRKRQSDEDVDDACRKQPLGFSCRAVRKLSRVSDAATSSGGEKVDPRVDFIQMTELSTSWSEISTAFDESPDPSRSRIEPLPSVSGIRPDAHEQTSQNERLLRSVCSFLGL